MPYDREKLADVQHEIWSSWMQWLFQCSRVNADGSVTIPSTKVQRWQRQMNTPYSELSESEKNSDRHQADRVIAVLVDKEHIEALLSEAVEPLAKRIEVPSERIESRLGKESE